MTVEYPSYRWMAKDDAPAWPCCYDDCTGTQVLVWAIGDVDKVRCLSCGGAESYALRECYRQHTRQAFDLEAEDLASDPALHAHKNNPRTGVPYILSRPEIGNGRVRNGRSRKAA